MNLNFNRAEFVTSYGLSSQLPQSSQPEIAFAGRSNVGKSSMINKLFNRKALARVSAVPGKTATINFYQVDHVNFVDLPGYGYAKVSKGEKQRWGQLIEKYFNDDRNFALIMQLIDMRHPPSKLDVDMVNYLIDREFPFIIVLTKSDKLNKTQTKERLAGFLKEIPCAEDITIVPFSSLTGSGVEELRNIICDVCGNAEDLDNTEEAEDSEEIAPES